MPPEQQLVRLQPIFTRKRLDELFKSLHELDLEKDICDRELTRFGFGASSDVFRARSKRHNKRVAVKCIRIFLLEDESFAKALEREVRLWSRLAHPNVLPLLGFLLDGRDAIPNLISEWMDKGTMTSYMRERPLDAKEICDMAVGIASGLIYLHNEEIIHSDLKGSNILVSDDGRPLLADFGMSISTVSLSLAGTIGHGQKGSMRWMAKELHSPIGDADHTMETDIWAFGMVICELLTRNKPYPEIKDKDIPKAILSGELPQQPDFSQLAESHVFCGLWTACRSCWNDDPSKRISGPDVLRDVNRLLTYASPDPSSEMLIRQSLSLQPQVSEPPEVDKRSLDYFQLKVDVSGVPDISAACTLAASVSELCVKMRRNKAEARELCDLCKTFCDMLTAVAKDGDGDLVQKQAAQFLAILQDIKASMEQWSKYNYGNALFHQSEVTESIAAYTIRLTVLNNAMKMESISAVQSNLSGTENIQADCVDDSNQISFEYKFKTKSDDDNIRQATGQVTERASQRPKNLLDNSDDVGQASLSLIIPPDMLHFDSAHAVAGSSTYDIYRGTYLSQVVVIKKAKAFAYRDGSKEQVLIEANYWTSVCKVDPNGEYLLHLIGVSFSGESLFIVNRWMENCDAFTYIRKERNSIDVRRMVRRIAKGLEILHSHSPPIVHGRLKASNIMVNDNDDPLLGGFGLTVPFKDVLGQATTETQGVNSFRRFAPEMLDAGALSSAPSGIYSFAMTVLELMTGQPPFGHIRRAPGAFAVNQSLRPPRPTDPSVISRGLDGQLWELLNRCWAQDPKARPDIFEINKELDRMWP